MDQFVADTLQEMAIGNPRALAKISNVTEERMTPAELRRERRRLRNAYRRRRALRRRRRRHGRPRGR